MNFHFHLPHSLIGGHTAAYSERVQGKHERKAKNQNHNMRCCIRCVVWLAGRCVVVCMQFIKIVHLFINVFFPIGCIPSRTARSVRAPLRTSCNNITILLRNQNSFLLFRVSWKLNEKKKHQTRRQMLEKRVHTRSRVWRPLVMCIVDSITKRGKSTKIKKTFFFHLRQSN